MDSSNFQKTVLTENVLLIKTGKILDNNNAHVMAEVIGQAKKSGHKFVIIDMAELEFLSSAGVGSILGSIEDFRDISGDIILCNASSTIHHVFAVLDLNDYLKIKNNIREAEALCR